MSAYFPRAGAPELVVTEPSALLPDGSVDLDAVERATEAATAKPWVVKRAGSLVWVSSKGAQVELRNHVLRAHDVDILADDDYSTKAADAEFLALARNVLPAMTAELRRLRQRG